MGCHPKERNDCGPHWSIRAAAQCTEGPWGSSGTAPDGDGVARGATAGQAWWDGTSPGPSAGTNTAAQDRKQQCGQNSLCS